MTNPSRRFYPCLLVVAALCFFSRPLSQFGHSIYPAIEVVRQYGYWQLFAAREIHDHGQLALWNPYTFSGAPFVANMQLGTFYPPFFLFYLAPVDYVFGVQFALIAVVLGLNAYLLLTRLGLSGFAGFLGALVAAFSGIASCLAYAGFLVHASSMAWSPLVLLAVINCCEAPRPRHAALLGGAVALCFLPFPGQGFFFTCFVACVYATCLLVVNWIRGTGRVLSGIATVAAGFALGLALVPVQLLPSLELIQYFGRPGGVPFEFSSKFSLPFVQLVTLLLPDLFGNHALGEYWGEPTFWDLCGYLGILPLLLAVFGIVWGKRDRHLAFFVCLAVFSLAFALGRHLPLYSFFFHHVPGFRLFRAPCRMLWFYTLSVAVLAAYGFDALYGHWRQRAYGETRLFNRLTACVFALAALALAALLLWGPWADSLLARLIGWYHATAYPDTPGHSKPLAHFLDKIPSMVKFARMDVLRLALAAGAILALVAAWRRHLIGHSALKRAFVVILLGELWSFGLPMVKGRPAKEVYAPSATIRFLSEDRERFRILDLTGNAPQHLTWRDGIESILGQDPVILAHYGQFACLIAELPHAKPEAELELEKVQATRLRHFHLLDALNVKYVLSRERFEQSPTRLSYGDGTPNWDLVQTLDDATSIYFFWKNVRGPVYIYRNRRALPRAFTVGSALVAQSRDEAFDKLRRFDPGREVVLEAKQVKAWGISVQRQTPDDCRPVEAARYAPNQVEMAASLAAPGFLVLSEVWYPGWRLYDNGQRRPVLTGNYALRATPLPAGEHKVNMVFAPASLKLGAAGSLAALAFLTALASAWRIRRTANRNEP